MRQEFCRSCDAPIKWARTSTGSLMPLDSEPTPDGLCELVGGKVTVHSQKPWLLTGELHTSHFATCPEADDWRSKKGK